MKTSTKSRNVSTSTRHPKIATGIRAGQIEPNHNRTRLAVKSGVKAGQIEPNHNRTRTMGR